MKATLTTARFLLISAAWATLPFAAPLHGAESDLPFTEDFQSSSFLDSAKTTARWSSGGVTLGRARGQHRADLTPASEDVFGVGNSSDNSDIEDIALHDMNGDGRLDIIAAGDDGIFVFLASEMNNLGAIQPVPVTATPSHGLAFGDFDRDGDLDIAAAGRRVSFYRNSGRGSFDAGVDVVALVAAGLAAADVDGDGHLDLVLARQGRSGAVEVHLNDGQGVFTEKTGAARQTNTFSRGLAVGDLDGDGDVDIAIGKFRNNNVYYLNDGDGGFGRARELRQTQRNHPNNGVALGDVNNDGLLDIVVGGRRANNLLYLSKGGGVFSTGTTVGHGTAVTLGVGLADLDGDGDLDLYEANLSGRGSFAYTNPGDGAYGMTGSRIGPKTNAIAAGDLNGDSAQDMVIGRNLASLDVGLGRNSGGPASAVRFDSARGRVVSGRIDIAGKPLHVVYFTATAAPSANSAIDYYLSNDDGNHWRRAHPGRSVRFPSPGNRLRWRAELRSLSPALSTTLTQIGVEGVLQVSIDGIVQQSDGDAYRASSRTVGEKFEAVLKLENRSNRPLETSIDFTGTGFKAENKPDSDIPPGSFHNAVLVFEPTKSGLHPSKLMISSTESGIALHRFELPLRGEGFAAEIRLSRRDSEVRVGSSKTQIVKVENEGNLDLKIDHPPTVSTSRFVLIDPDPSSGFPLTVSASKSVSLAFRFKPEARGTVTGSVTFVSNAIGTTRTITLRGKGLASEIDVVINDTPMSQADSLYNFNDWPVNAVTSARVDITNADGDASLRVEPLEPLDSTERRHFSLEVDKPFPLAVDELATEGSVMTLNFRPKNHGPQTATIVFVSNAINGTQTITLTGRGLGSEMQLRIGDKTLAEGATHTFSATKVNTSKTVSVQVHNHGNVPMNISTPTLAKVGDLTGFSLVESGGLPDTVPEGSSASFTFRFRPTAPGTATALVTFASDAVNATRTTIFLQGRGTMPMISVTPTGTIEFGGVRAGTSTDRHVTITNTGDATLEVTSARVINGGAAELLFSVVSPARFPHPVGVGEDLMLTVRFSPLEPMDGNVRGILEIKSDASNRLPKHPQVSGKGVGSVMAVVITDTGVRKVNANDDSTPLYDFGDVPINTSASRRVFISNQRGEAPLRVEIPSPGAAEHFRWQNDPVPEEIVVEAGESTSVLVLVFEPEERGPQVTTLTFASDAFDNATQTVTLTGRGVGAVMVVQVGGMTLTSSETINLRTPPNVEVTTDIVVWNRGSADLEVNPIGLLRVDGLIGEVAEKHRLSGGSTRTIPENSSHTWTVSFTPSYIRFPDMKEVRIFSNDDKASPFILNVQGVGAAPALSTSFRGCNRVLWIYCEMGNIRVGTTASVDLFIRNWGNEPLIGTATVVYGDPIYRVYSTDGPDLFEINLGPYASTRRTIRVSPLDANLESPVGWELPEKYREHWRGLWVNVLTNAYDVPDRTVDVWAKVIGPEMHVDIGSPSSIYTGSTETRKREHDFGDVAVGTSETVPLTIRNVGNEPLMVTASVSGAYRLLKKDGSSAKNQLITIGAGLNEPLDLRFVPPAAPSTYAETLTITSNDYDEGVYEVVLAGRGTGPRMVVEVADTARQFGEEFNFGKMQVNNTTSVVVRVRNTGDGDLMITAIGTSNTKPEFLDRKQSWVDQLRPTLEERRKEAYHVSDGRARTIAADSSSTFILNFRPNIPSSADRALLMISSNDPDHPDWSLNLTGKGSGHLLRVNLFASGSYSRVLEEAYSRAGEGLIAHHLGDSAYSYPYGVAFVRISSLGDIPMSLPTFEPERESVTDGEGFSWGWGGWNQQNGPDGTWSYIRNIDFFRPHAGMNTGTLIISSDDDAFPEIRIRLTAAHLPAQSWASGTQRPAVPAFTELEPADIIAPRFVGLGYADWQSRLWLAFDEPAQILSGAGSSALTDGAVLSGFEALANYAGAGAVEDIGVRSARYRSGGVVMELARSVVPADASLWVRYTPPSDGVSGIYDLAAPPNRISSVRLFMLPRSAVLDYDGDGFPDALEARLGGNPLVPDDVVGLPEVALLRAGAAGSPAAVAYSGIRADGVAAHLGVVTAGASSLAAYYLSDTFGYSGGYALGVGGYGCTGRFPADYASPLRGGGCAVVDFNNIRAGVEHRIGWLATNDAGYWAVVDGTTSRLPEQVILRVPEFNMKRRNVFVPNFAAADETVVVDAFHDGPASSQSLTVSLSNVVAADSPSSLEPDGFSVSVAGGAASATPGTTPDSVIDVAPDGATSATPNTTSYAITGVHSGEDSKLWLAGDPLSSLTPDKYSLGKVTQTDVVRLADGNLPPLFGRASLYASTTADENERHAVVVRGTENYIALLPVVQGSAQTASAFEVSPWDGVGGGPVAADDRILAVNAASPVADGALVRIAFTASNPPATVRNTVSLEVAASSAGADTATTVLTWPVIDSADALASIAGDDDNDGVPDVRDSYPLLNRLPIAVAGGVTGYPDRTSAGADGWHHIRPLLPLHRQFAGSYATRAGLSFHTGFVGDARILVRLPVATSEGQTIAAPEGQTPLAATYQPGVAIQMNYADFAASLSRDEFGAMARQARRDIAVVYNFRLHGVEPSVAEGATLAGGRAGVVIPLPESLRETTNISPLHYTNGAWSDFSTDPDTPATAGFAPLQAGACPDDSGTAGSPYHTTSGVLNTRKRPGDACMVLYLTDGAAADRDGNINGIVDALIGLAATAPPR